MVFVRLKWKKESFRDSFRREGRRSFRKKNLKFIANNITFGG